ncbi:MAG TPA: AAA family ATPase, partial [Candidatus Nanoarchaeia archaeon]|nr:AAA family ATPase [Candidatus Nanoarchaeia archaeon]
MLPFTLTYAPQSAAEVLGQEKAIASIKSFLTDFKKQKKKALLLYGPAGSGKTCAVYACARDAHSEVLEVNASDFRNEGQLQKTIGNASVQRSLFGNTKVLLVDEVEGIAGVEDRGGLAALKRLISESKYPILLTANDVWDKKFSSLRSSCELVECKELSFQHMLQILRGICQKESIVYEEKALVALARRCGGDARGALIDLQTLLD